MVSGRFAKGTRSECADLAIDVVMARPGTDYTGVTFGRLTLLARAPNKGHTIMWHAQCSCGSPLKVVVLANVRSGVTKSCGCLRAERAHDSIRHAQHAAVERRRAIRIESAHLIPLKTAARKRRRESRRLEREFGITLEDYDRMLSNQAGLCAICGHPNKHRRRFHVDHCHTSGAVRGLLCNTCNAGLGQFHDDIRLLESAINYLRIHQRRGSAA